MWTKNGMEEAFLGITVHFVHPSTLNYHHLTLACRSFKKLKHTAPNIVREMASIFDQWKIDLEKVSVVVTDNGSNMVAAFKNHVELVYDIGLEEDDIEDSVMSDGTHFELHASFSFLILEKSVKLFYSSIQDLMWKKISLCYLFRIVMTHAVIKTS